MTTQMGAQTRQTEAPQQMQSTPMPDPARPPRQAPATPAPQPQMGGAVFDDWAAI